MRILDAEMDLRDETRSVNQSYEALVNAQKEDEYEDRAHGLSKTQSELQTRLEDVIADIKNLPEGAQKFGKEIQLLSAALQPMTDAADTLGNANTGPAAIAAETEVIELLLQSKRANPNGGGGGGGASPGGGGSGDTDRAALALYGPGEDAQAIITERVGEQATGISGPGVPREFKDGLEAFFRAVDEQSR